MLSVVIPCYNCADFIEDSVYNLVEGLHKSNILDYEIVLVDDGSCDDTINRLSKLHECNLNINFISYRCNMGKGYAVKRGFQRCSGKYVIFVDADLSTDVSNIAEVCGELSHSDVVIGSRTNDESKVKRSKFRSIVSYVCNVFVKLLTGLEFRDTQCGLKGFRKEVVDYLLNTSKIDRFAFDVEFLKLVEDKFFVKELPVNWVESPTSVVKYKDFFVFLRDLLRIKFSEFKKPGVDV